MNVSRITSWLPNDEGYTYVNEHDDNNYWRRIFMDDSGADDLWYRVELGCEPPLGLPIPF